MQIAVVESRDACELGNIGNHKAAAFISMTPAVPSLRSTLFT